MLNILVPINSYNLKIIKTTPDQWENIKSSGNDITKLGNMTLDEWKAFMNIC